MSRQEEHIPDSLSNGSSRIPPIRAMIELEHLLKVAGSVTADADATWSEVWTELKKFSSTDGNGQKTEEGFTPSCGWPEFLEKVWELKYYLDSIQRICSKNNQL